MSYTVAAREDRTALGLGLMAGAVLFFTMIDTSAKWLVLAGVPTLQVVFARYFVHLVLSIVLFLPREGWGGLRSKTPTLQLLRSVFLFSGTALNFTALKYLPITVTTTIMFAGPILVTLLAIPLLGEKVGIHRIVAVCLGFVGVIIVMQPWGVGFHPAMLLTLLSLCLSSCYFIVTRKLAGVEGSAVSQIWPSGLALICIAPFALSDWVWPVGAANWTFFALVGVFGGMGHILANWAHRLADASILAPVIYIQILLAAVVSVIFFDTWPTIWTLAGGAVIIGAGAYIWHRERKGGSDVSLTTREG